MKPFSKWFILKVFLFGSHWGRGYCTDDTSYSIEYRGNWYSLSLKKAK